MAFEYVCTKCGYLGIVWDGAYGQPEKWGCLNCHAEIPKEDINYGTCRDIKPHKQFMPIHAHYDERQLKPFESGVPAFGLNTPAIMPVSPITP